MGRLIQNIDGRTPGLATRVHRITRCASPLVATAAFLAGAAAGEAPVELDGLVAWYSVDTLHRTHNDGYLVKAWPDASAGGHDITWQPNSVAAVFETMQVSVEPAVRIRGRTSFGIEQPFELGDHTIFLVLGSEVRRKGLFYDDRDERSGLILFDEDGYQRLHMGDPQRLAAYNETPVSGDGFRILVLSRKSGILGCSVDGVDISSRAQFPDPVRVGGFFRVRTTSGMYLEGDGLQIAEMIFYDRRLSDEESATLTAYLSEKYGIAVAEPPAEQPPEPPPVEFLPAPESARAWLETGIFTDVNAEPVVIPWQKQVKLEPPFSHDPEGDDTRLRCTRDGTRAELFVQIPLKTSARGTSVRVLILKNGREYLPAQGDSGPIRGKNPKRATVRLTATLEMNAGDYIEVVATGSGEPGVVAVDPYRAALVLRAE